MHSHTSYREQIVSNLVSSVQANDNVYAAWEGGSAANGTLDEFSDFDFNIVADEGAINETFDRIESSLNTVSRVQHVWAEGGSAWPELTQRIYILEDSPKHFFVDVSVFPRQEETLLQEFMQTERHGTPVVLFDKPGLITPRPADKVAIELRQKKLLKKYTAGFPVFEIEVYKELDRGNNIDALAFFQMALLKPTVEVLGILYRPFQFDFGLRYLNRSFPRETYDFIEECMYMRDAEALRTNTARIKDLFYKAARKAEKILEIRSSR